MALWSGATQYLRVPDVKREMWYPAECSPSDEIFVWKVKHDLETGRYFFVNLAGFGKRWRLPDIYDIATQEELRVFVASKTGSAASLRLPAPKLPTPTVTSGGRRGNTNLPGMGGAAGSPADPYASISPVTAPDAEAPRSSRKSKKEEKFGRDFDDDSRAPYQRQGQDLDLSAAIPQDMLINYDSPDEWSNLTPVSSAKQSQAAAQAESGRKRQMEQENLLMQKRTPPSAYLPIPKPSEGDAQLLAEYRELEAEVAAVTQQKEIDARLRAVSEHRTAIIFDEQQKRLDEKYRRDLAEIEAVEQDHAARIRRESEHIASHSPTREEELRGSSAFGAIRDDPAFFQYGGAMRSPSPRAGNSASLAVIPTVSHQDSFQGIDGAATVSLALSQVEHERKTNERLMRELDEKERLLTEHRIADIEREQQQLALRMRLLDALVAHRQKMQLLHEEDPTRGGSLEYRGGRERGTLGGRSPESAGRGMSAAGPGGDGRRSGSYVPPHPLMDNFGDDLRY